MRHVIRATRRSLLRSPGHVISVISLSAVAVCLYAGTAVGLAPIQVTLDQVYADQRMFDLEVRVPPAPLEKLPEAAKLVAQVPGLEAATWRLVVPGAVELSGERAAGAMIVAVSPRERPQVSDVRLVAGEFLAPGKPDEVVVEKTFAEDMGLKVGDTFVLRVRQRSAPARVRGIGIFPEFMVSSVDPSFPIPLRKTLCAVLASQEKVAEVADSALANSLAVRFAPGAGAEEVRARLKQALEDSHAPVVGYTWRADQFSVMVNRVRLTGIRDVLPAFILVVDSLAFLTLLVVVRRMAQDWRHDVGTLLAFGYSRGRIVFGWVLGVSSVVAIGALLGSGGAVLVAKWISAEYVRGVGLPMLIERYDYRPLAEAWAACVLFAVPASLAPVLALIHQRPARLLHEEPPGGIPAVVALVRFLELPLTKALRLGYAGRLGLRNVFRRPLVFATSLVAVSGMMVVAASFYLISEALGRILDDYADSQRWTYMVELNNPASKEELSSLMSEVKAGPWEELGVVEGQIRHGGREWSYLLVAAPVPSSLRQKVPMVEGHALTADGAPELVVNLELAQTAGLHAGDEVEVAVGDATGRLRVAGVMTKSALNEAFIGLHTLEALTGKPVALRAALLQGPSSLGLALTRRPEIARVVPRDALLESGRANNAVLDSGLRLYGHLSAFTALLLILVVFHVNVTDRLSEYAVFRTLGFSTGLILRSLLVELVAFAACVVALSLPATRLCTWYFQRRIEKIYDWVPVDGNLGTWARLMAVPMVLMFLTVLPSVYRATHVRAALMLRTRVGA
jgi:predicted lysophospholipase L1 biosynthesis ABC-type transport system permease subunit